MHSCRSHAFLSSPLHFPRFFPTRLVENWRREIHSHTSPSIHRLRISTLHLLSSINVIFGRHIFPSSTKHSINREVRYLTLEPVTENQALKWIDEKTFAASKLRSALLEQWICHVNIGNAIEFLKNNLTLKS